MLHGMIPNPRLVRFDKFVSKPHPRIPIPFAMINPVRISVYVTGRHDLHMVEMLHKLRALLRKQFIGFCFRHITPVPLF